MNLHITGKKNFLVIASRKNQWAVNLVYMEGVTDLESWATQKRYKTQFNLF